MLDTTHAIVTPVPKHPPRDMPREAIDAGTQARGWRSRIWRDDILGGYYVYGQPFAKAEDAALDHKARMKREHADRGDSRHGIEEVHVTPRPPKDDEIYLSGVVLRRIASDATTLDVEVAHIHEGGPVAAWWWASTTSREERLCREERLGQILVDLARFTGAPKGHRVRLAYRGGYLTHTVD